MTKKEKFWLYFPFGIALFLTVLTPVAINRLIDTSRLVEAKRLVGWGVVGVFGGMVLHAKALNAYSLRALSKSAEISRELLGAYEEGVERTEEFSKAAKEAQGLVHEVAEDIRKLEPMINLVDDLLEKISDHENLTADAMPAMLALPAEHDYAARVAALQSDLEAMIDFRLGIFPRRGPGRPGKVISIPTAGGQAVSKPIKDPAVMAYLVRLQEAKERGELAQACKENPWGGPAVPVQTAYSWLKNYRDEIAVMRNSE